MASRWPVFPLVGCFFVVLGFPPAPLHAQSTTGIILGSVMDSSGGVLPGAAVTVTHIDTGLVRTAVSEANGAYQNPRPAARRPGSFTVDASLIKQFEPWGSDNAKNVQFRLEVFNLLNTVNLGAPVTARNAGNFGQITTAGDPRIVQLALRFGF